MISNRLKSKKHLKEQHIIINIYKEINTKLLVKQHFIS